MTTQAKEKQILRAAEELFTSKRYHEVTLDEVCHVAGVGKGTIYRYFKDKEELFLRVVSSGSEEMCELIRLKKSAGMPFEKQLGEVLVEIQGLMQRRRELFRIAQSEEARAAGLGGAVKISCNERRNEVVNVLAELIEHGMREGCMRSDVPPKLLASTLLGMLRGYTRETPTELANDSGRRVMDLFLRGAAASSWRTEKAIS